jgi:hypothetical protein
VEGGDLLGVAAQGERERFGDGFAGEVVFSGAEAAHEDENVVRPRAVRMALTRSLRRSPTMVLKATVTPISLSFQ